MRVSNIKTPEDGYNELLSTLFNSYDIDTNMLKFEYKEEMPIIPLTTLEDKKTFISCLFEFTLDEDTIETIRKRYGLNDGNALTLKQIGAIKEVSDERVRGIVRNGIRKAKHPLNVKRAIDRWFRGI